MLRMPPNDWLGFEMPHSPLPLAGGAGGGLEAEMVQARLFRAACPPLTPPASGRGMFAMEARYG
jgi:hypothetical protein